ncbi:MAG: hypothetical protein KF850_42760 [Labilithrix sp.]|nr:hypothetical protein [Labilithrix sp.]
MDARQIMDRGAAEKALVKLATQTAATWQRVRGEAFLGETILETGNTLYRFVDGVLSARAPRPARADQAPEWASPLSMKGVVLLGFLADAGGLWSLSPGWRPGSLAVITTNAQALTLTSPTVACTISRPERSRAETAARSSQPAAPATPPPTVRRPAPPSMTRLQPALAR